MVHASSPATIDSFRETATRSVAPVTFVLPGDGRSGGVRVTVIMANLLLDRGWAVRIAFRRPRRGWRSWISGLRRTFSARSAVETGFLHLFKGQQAAYRNLDEVSFQTGEIVVAVGTYTVSDVRALSQLVTKVRFNHGFPARPSPLDEAAWRGRMPTITVSNTLVPRLQEQTEGSVWGVVPNGIETREYFVEPTIPRIGLGALYNRHPNKAPEDLIAVLQEAHRRWPDVPQQVFGTEPRPLGLEHVKYTQLPAIPQARRIYNSCLVWVLTSRTEGLPGVVLEAMACGCLVVSTDNDGSLELLRHDQNGLIAPCGNRDGLLHQIGRGLECERLRKSLTAEAAVTVQAYTWSRAADRMEAFLGEVSSCGR